MPVRGFVYKMGLLGWASWSLLGCQAPCEPVVLDTEGASPAVDFKELAELLHEAVTEEHLLDPEAAEARADALDGLLKRLAVTGPGVTPGLFVSSEQALAYWYNARAAWAIKLAELAGFPERMRREELCERAFPLDGREMTLERIDERILSSGGWRAVVAAPGVCLDRARLPREPFGAEDIRDRVEQRLNDFIDDQDRFVIDVENQEVDLPPVLCQFAPQLVERHHRRYETTGATVTTALLPFVRGSARRRLQDAVGYRCRSAPRCGRLAVVEE